MPELDAALKEETEIAVSPSSAAWSRERPGTYPLAIWRVVAARR
jgi:hypothetical protein